MHSRPTSTYYCCKKWKVVQLANEAEQFHHFLLFCNNVTMDESSLNKNGMQADPINRPPYKITYPV